MTQRRSAITALKRRFGLEPLERRCMLSAVPYGAAADDTAEYMLGDVLVSVVLLESDGTLDPSSEDWTGQAIQETKDRIVEGMQWWSDVLKERSTVHELNFQFDFQFADDPIQTGYEPIARPSNDFTFWIDDFFAAAGVAGRSNFSDRILDFNHQQRLSHGTDWAFTIFVVNAEHDSDSRFDTSGSFSRAFAYAGGRFFVATSERPASTFAHEAAHMFWAMDEYAGSKSYDDHRGYHDTQNTNAFDDHPDVDSRVRSIMDSHLTAFEARAVSPSTMEMIGWKDSDQDGVFDVLDVPHRLQGSGEFDSLTSTYSFSGLTEVVALPNRNPDGNGNAITLNRISDVEARFDGLTWQSVGEFDAYAIELELDIPVPKSASQIAIRSIDHATGVTSTVFVDTIEQQPLDSWQNVELAADVNDDQSVSPLDALLVINELNLNGPRELSSVPPPELSVFVDVNGDGFISAIDALFVINQLNSVSTSPESALSETEVSPAAEGETPDLAVIAAAFDNEIKRRLPLVEADSTDEPAFGSVRTARRVDLAIGEFFNDELRTQVSHELLRSLGGVKQVSGLPDLLNTDI